MKHKSLFLVLSLLLTLPVAAADNLGAHSFVIWANGGVSNYIGSTPGAKMSLGGGGGVGLGYEWRGAALLLQTGLGAKYTQSGLRIDDTDFVLKDQFDAQAVDNTFDFVYRQTNRRDSYNSLALQVPLLVGAHVSNFYFLIGAKLNVNILNSYKANANYSAYGLYKEFFDPFEAMPNHGFFTEQPLQTNGTTAMKINVAGSLELGGEFALGEATKGSTDNYMRIGAFADMNILDDRIGSGKELLSYPATYTGNASINDLKMVDYLSSNAATSPVRNMLAGVKLTFIFASGIKYGCVMCEAGYPTKRDRRRGSRLMLY